jgi:GABA permease
MYVEPNGDWKPARDASRPPRIVVVANETVAGAALHREVAERARARGAQVVLVCPALNSRFRHWLSDDDRARAEARRRLDASLAALADEGVDAVGQIGDSDPLRALEDALRAFGADEIVLSTHPPGRSNWLERDVVERARALHDLPITHVVVDLEGERAPSRFALRAR